MGGVQKGQNLDYVMYEWPLTHIPFVLPCFVVREGSKFRHIVMDLNWPLFLAIFPSCPAGFLQANTVEARIILLHTKMAFRLLFLGFSTIQKVVGLNHSKDKLYTYVH